MREVEVEGAGEGEQMELEESEDMKPQVRIQPKRTKREQVKLSRKKQFELPDDFIVITKKSKGRSWKEYLGPDGNIFSFGGNLALIESFRKEISVSSRHPERPGQSHRPI